MTDHRGVVPDTDRPPREPELEPARTRHRLRDLARSPEVVASVIVGCLTVFAAIAGAAATNLIEVRQTVTAPSSGELSGDVASLQEQLAASQEEVEALRGQVVALEDENVQLGGTASSDQAGDTTTTGSEPEIFRESTEPFTIGGGTCIDLDSEAANWGRESDSGLWAYEPEDLCFVDQELQLREVVVIEDGGATLETCEGQTELQGDTVLARYVREGLRVCGITSDGRPVSVGVVDTTAVSVTLDVRVWQ